MSALMLMIILLCVFALAYRYYAAFIGAKIMMLDDRNITPSVSCNDGRDYIPTNKWVVFGHHFAAIAGAGPLIGPTLAAQFGWGPGFFWIMLGSVFAGCVHD
jgi:carbon starvation protein